MFSTYLLPLRSLYGKKKVIKELPFCLCGDNIREHGSIGDPTLVNAVLVDAVLRCYLWRRGCEVLFLTDIIFCCWNIAHQEKRLRSTLHKMSQE